MHGFILTNIVLKVVYNESDGGREDDKYCIVVSGLW